MTDSTSPLNRLESTLLSALKRTIENLIFEEIDISDEINISNYLNNQSASSNPIIWSKIPIYYPYKGDICLSISLQFAINITSLIHSMEIGDDKQALCLDTLSEITNTVAGCFMEELTPPEETFGLGLPISGIGGISGDRTDSISVSFTVGDESLNALISGEEIINLNNKIT